MKCNVCGGDLISREDGLLVCEFCGNVYHDKVTEAENIQQQELEAAIREKSKAGIG